MVFKCLEELVKFQNVSVSLEDKIFDESVLLWETDYFLERFIFRVCGLRNYYLENSEAIDKERHQLAMSVGNQPRKLMHRDFQSENVMIKDGEPWLIDFQAAHVGTPIYDAASFIGDPYMDYSAARQDEFRTYYFQLLKNKSNFDMLDFEKA